MKREREEVLISSDSEDEEEEEESEEDWEEDADGFTDEEVEIEDEDDDEDEYDGGDDDDDEDDYDDDDINDEIDDYSLSDGDDDSIKGDSQNDDDSEEEDDARSSDSEQFFGSNSRKRVTSGLFGIRGAESAQQGQKWSRQKQKLTKGSGHTSSHKTSLSKEDQKLFSESLNIIRRGDLEKLTLEHCKAYLRRYSLRLAGTRSVVFDRVQEHIELRAHGGMAKYPRPTFTVNCTGDACTGDVVLFTQRVKRNNKNAGKSSTMPCIGKRIVAGRIVKESYGSDKQQHTFTVEVLWSKGPKQLPFLYPLLIKGRNLYRFRTFRQRWPNEEERRRVLQEKHSRGDVARSARECRVSGKRYSCTSRTRMHKRGRVAVRKESRDKVELPQVNKAGSRSRKAARSNVTRQESTFKERSMTSTAGSFNVRNHEKRSCESSGTTISTLTIKACYAGILIGTQGRHIGAISRASGAELRVRDHPWSSTLRIVEILGALEHVQVAARMVVQSFMDRGLPPPSETT